MEMYEELVDMFMQVTNIENRELAVNILNINNWDIEEAVLYHTDLPLSAKMDNLENKTEGDTFLKDVRSEDITDNVFNDDATMNNKTSASLQEKEDTKTEKENEKIEAEEKEKKTNENKKKKESEHEVLNEDENTGNNDEMTNKENNEINDRKYFFNIFKPLVIVLSPFFKKISNFISMFIKFVSAFLMSAYTETDFISYYERTYGKYHVNFFKGSYKKAILESKKENKLLVIYCHEEKLESNHFCEHILNDSKVKDFVDGNFVFYADSTSRSDVSIINLMKKKIAFPAILVTLPVDECSVKLLRYINGKPTADEVTYMLSRSIEDMFLVNDRLKFKKQFVEEILESVNTFMEDKQLNKSRKEPNAPYTNGDKNAEGANTELGRAKTEKSSNVSKTGVVRRNVNVGTNLRSSRNMSTVQSELERSMTNRLIREEQDREYQEALLIDQMREAEKEEKQRLKRLKANIKNEIKEKRENMSKNFSIKVNEGEETTKICSRFSNGKRIQQVFSVEHTLRDVYEWVECSEFLENGIKVPYKFELICGHSKMILENSEIKIKNFDLFPNAILNVKSLDSSDEE